MLTTPRTGLVAGLAGLLVAGSFSAIAAPAQAATVDPTTIGGVFTWDVSNQVVARYGAVETADGAFQADADVRKVSFPVESVTAAGGDLTIAYQGAFDSQFKMSGSVLYSTKIEDPTVTIDADGSGELSAVVSGYQNFAPTYPLQQTTPTRVVVGEFAATSGDLATDLQATIGDFSAAFVNQLADGTKPHFNGSTEAKKANPFTLSQPSAAARVVTEAGVRRVEVVGKNFFGGDANYQGVYTGVAPAGGQPDTSTQQGADAYAGKDWVVPSRIVNGSFTSVFDLDEEKVVAGTEYAAYTWQAHRHTSPALDTEAPLGVLKTPAVATRTTLTATGGTLAATLTAKVTPAAAGKIVFKEGSKTLRTVTVVNGAATVKLTGLTGGTKTYSASFVPAVAADFKASAAPAVRATVAKAASKTTIKVTKKATRKKTGKATVSISGSGVKATGKAKVVIKAPGKKTITKKVTLKKGKASVALTKAKKKGTYKLSVSYSGDKKLKAAKKVTKTFKVKK